MTHELIPGGQEVPVTQENKRKYIHHYVQWYFKRGIDHQLQAVQNGFNELIPHHLLKDFDEKELEVSSHTLPSAHVTSHDLSCTVNHKWCR